MSSAEAMTRYAGGVANYRASEGKAVLRPYRGPVEATLLDVLGEFGRLAPTLGLADSKNCRSERRLFGYKSKKIRCLAR